MLPPPPLILLSLCFFTLWAVLKEASLQNNLPRWGNRDSLLLATITQGSILVLLIEILSAFHSLQRKYLINGWAFILLMTLLLFVYLRTSRKGINRDLFNLKDWKTANSKINLTVAGFLCLVGFQFFTLAMVAYVYPPNNWDSMTYHLPRVMHWQQNQSVASYATNIERQIQSQPFTEYEIANLQVMLENDQYANFVQYFAFFICFIGVTSITKKLGGSTNQQIFTGVISISIPMAILQSTSTQTDLKVSQWVISFVAMGISLIQEPKKYLWVFGTGLSLGLACLTKATAFIFVMPFCIWFGISIVKDGLKNVATGLFIGVLALSINSGFFIRNILLYSNPLGARMMFYTMNQIYTFGALASNVIRNIAINFSDKQNIIFLGILNWLHLLNQFSGFNNVDPRITLYPWDIFRGFEPNQVLLEDNAGNPIHAILIASTIFFSFYIYSKFKIHHYVMQYSFCLIISFLLFSYFLKFQVWGNRLLLPLFVLWSPIIILILVAKNEKILKYFIIAIFLYSLYWTFGNSIRAINLDALNNSKNREQNFFATNPYLYPVYADISDKISASSCDAVGLIISEDTWEYPLWAMLANRKWHGRIEHINVINSTSALVDNEFVPCAVISDRLNGKDNYPYYQETKYIHYREVNGETKTDVYFLLQEK